MHATTIPQGKHYYLQCRDDIITYFRNEETEVQRFFFNLVLVKERQDLN